MNQRDVKEIAKTIRQELKKAHPECKFSVRIARFAGGNAIDVNLMSGPFVPFTLEGKMRGQVNQYLLCQNYADYLGTIFGPFQTVSLTREAWDVMVSAVEIGNRENWDNSDLTIDYFDVNYYFSIAVGKWDKKYEVTK
jgi:hypothetical protein